MATPITNQATLTYKYGAQTGSSASNIATTILQGPFAVEKTSLAEQHRAGDDLTYVLTLRNNSSAALTNVQIVDDLGTYTIPGPVNVRPLTYTGPSRLYINGAYTGDVTPVISDYAVTYNLATLAPGVTAMILYKATVNDFALRDTGATLTNRSVVTADGATEQQAAYTIGTEDFADVRIIKTMSPNPVIAGGAITYTFTLHNYGNMDATEVVLTDAFDPAPTALALTLNANPVAAGDLDYTGGVLTVPSVGSALAITIPAATYTQDPATGRVTVSPGAVELVASGSL